MQKLIIFPLDLDNTEKRSLGRDFRYWQDPGPLSFVYWAEALSS